MFILEDVYCQCTHELNLYCIFEYINRSRLKKMSLTLIFLRLFCLIKHCVVVFILLTKCERTASNPY